MALSAVAGYNQRIIDLVLLEYAPNRLNNLGLLRYLKQFNQWKNGDMAQLNEFVVESQNSSLEEFRVKHGDYFLIHYRLFAQIIYK